MTLLDHFSESEKTGSNLLVVVHPSHIGDYSAMGQCFTMGASNKKICKAKFYLQKIGSPVGHLKAALYAVTGSCGTNGRPTGDPLALSDSVTMESVGTDYVLVEFIFTGDEKYEMQASTTYCIECLVSDATLLDLDNCINVGIADEEPTHNGNWSGYIESSWNFTDGTDTIFYVYGEAV